MGNVSPDERRRNARERKYLWRGIAVVAAAAVLHSLIIAVVVVSVRAYKKAQTEELRRQQKIQEIFLPTPAPEKPPEPTKPQEQMQQTQEREPQEPTQPQITAKERDKLLRKADRLAVGYDYDAAVKVIRSIESYSSDPALVEKIRSYKREKSKLVRYADPTTIPHVFFHSLIADNSRAFDGDYESDGYNLYMTTIYEFRHILSEMYKNGFVLVDIHDIATEKKDKDGHKVFVPGDIMLPKGKKPFVMSQDDVNYYEYMVDGDGDHFADADGDGFATKLVIGEDGYPTCEYITADGKTLRGDYDLVPILEKFIQKHPDFSYRGARATLGVTGYEGVLGYRTHPDWKKILGTEAYEKERKEAKKVARCLREHGWTLASHSFGHPAYGEITEEHLINDVRKWEEQVQPILGDTDVFLYPYGSDIAGVEAYSGVRYQTMYEAGYRYFCNVDSAEYWVQIHDRYVRQGRRNLDGYRLYWNPGMLDDLFSVDRVLDPERPLPVPEL